jgi:hypothetical protein
MDSNELDEVIPGNTNLQAEEIFNLGSGCAPSGTRTPNPLVKRADHGLAAEHGGLRADG